MRIVLFCHSLLSDWNHGNAHFLRGVVTELALRGHEVHVYEPRDAWSLQNLIADHGEAPLDEVKAVYPHVAPIRYDLASLDLDRALDGASLVIVHEWSEPELVARVGAHRVGVNRARASYQLLFHDTHHRSVTDPGAMARYDLAHYDGVLAFGRVIRDLYLARRWARRAFIWHEAADARVFRPRREAAPERDLVWVGNWGDEERTRELDEFLIGPARDLGLSARVHGVRYPEHARAALASAGIEYRGWLANYRAPEAFGRARLTVHVPRRPYVESLPGIPTIRPFEAMACAIPLVCSPWNDAEELFSPGRDYLVARDGDEMKRHLRALLADPAMAAEMAERGRKTVLARHTCAHRAEELLHIAADLGVDVDLPAPAATPHRATA
ncbi:CgeB family protein [Sorangium sp. So ce131]|uniref:CgeB family protein n=1 Tax=Sorangium sp. So ce131 TaxID=3133282 RepID=UPI003F5F141F